MPYNSNQSKKQQPKKGQMPSHVGLFQKLRDRRNKTNSAIKSFREGYGGR